jgi:hypothetical protein
MLTLNTWGLWRLSRSGTFEAFFDALAATSETAHWCRCSIPPWCAPMSRQRAQRGQHDQALGRSRGGAAASPNIRRRLQQLASHRSRSSSNCARISKVDLRRLRVVLRPYVRAALRSERIELIGAAANGKRAEQGGERRLVVYRGPLHLPRFPCELRAGVWVLPSSRCVPAEGRSDNARQH